MNDLQAARVGTVVGVCQAADLESALWLCPIDDRRRYGEVQAGLVEGLSLGSYVGMGSDLE